MLQERGFGLGSGGGKTTVATPSNLKAKNPMALKGREPYLRKRGLVVRFRGP